MSGPAPGYSMLVQGIYEYPARDGWTRVVIGVDLDHSSIELLAPVGWDEIEALLASTTPTALGRPRCIAISPDGRVVRVYPAPDRDYEVAVLAGPRRRTASIRSALMG